MKEQLKKYLFEVMVIFIGITMSFLFEAWRNNMAEKEKVITQLTVLRNDLHRAKNWIEQIDSSYIETISLISKFRSNEGLSEEAFVDLISKISEEPVDFPLRELSPYLHQISNSNELSKINESDRIVTLIAYINNLTQIDNELSKSISDYIANNTWSKLDHKDLLSQLVRDNGIIDDTIVWSDARYSLSTLQNLSPDFYFIESKLNKILQVHEALSLQIDRLKEELDKT